ncbi:MAG: hypothetical protein GY951_12410, partial [Psychromonas sp.]|nr:hypothetical protein [Psychromonas sp.]
ERELAGIEALDAVPELHRAYIEQRAMVNRYFNDDEEVDEEQIAKGHKRATYLLDSLHHTAAKYDISLQIEKMVKDWQHLQTNGLDMFVDENTHLHNQMLNRVENIVKQIATKSDLLLDPEIDTSFLIETSQFKLFELADYTTQLTDKAIEVASFGVFTETGVSAIKMS